MLAAAVVVPGFQTNLEKSCFVLCQLVSKGRVPLLCLNDVISAVLRGGPRRRVGWLLLQAFYQCRLSAGSHTGENEDCLVIHVFIYMSHFTFIHSFIHDYLVEVFIFFGHCVSVVCRCFPASPVAAGADGPHEERGLRRLVRPVWRHKAGMFGMIEYLLPG